jgi:hypothetical protein
MRINEKKKLTVKVNGVEIDVENLKDEDIRAMKPEEVTEAIVKILQNTDKETKKELIRGMMRYIRRSGFNTFSGEDD